MAAKGQIHWRRRAAWTAFAFVLYVLSTGPVAWATNDGLHPAILPGKLNAIYWPLAPLLKMEWINQVFFYYTVILWGGYPAGYTTL